jgi:phosphohistidine swiveling domain-containing protein
MIAGVTSGVAFSVNPVTGDPFEIVIEFAPGRCTTVTDGEGRTQTTVIKIPEFLDGKEPCEPFRSIAQVCLDYTEPVDVEWTQQLDGELYILQVRPASAVLYTPPAVSNFKPTFPEPFSPLGAAIEFEKTRRYRRVLRRLVNPRYRHVVYSSYSRLFHSIDSSRRTRGTGFLLHGIVIAVAHGIRYLFRRRSALRAVRRLSTSTLEPPRRRLLRMVNRYLDLYEDSIYVGYLYNLANGGLAHYASWLAKGEVPVSLSYAVGARPSVATTRASRLEALAREFTDTAEQHWLDAQTDSFKSKFNDFCATFGYVFVGTNPRDPRSSVDMTVARHLIETYRSGLCGARIQEGRSESPRSVTVRRSFSGLHRGAFAIVRRAHAVLAPVKEDRNHVFYTLVGAISALVRGGGPHLATDIGLQQADDSFFMTLSELQTRRVLPRHIVRRRWIYSRALHSRSVRPSVTTSGTAAASVFKGIPCSPGSATGPAVVVRERGDFARIQQGCVLITTTVRPFWTPALRVAAAIVSSEGGILSHGASIAREYGVPAVFGLGSEILRVADGTILTVHGTTGDVCVGSDTDQ